MRSRDPPSAHADMTLVLVISEDPQPAGFTAIVCGLLTSAAVHYLPKWPLSIYRLLAKLAVPVQATMSVPA